MLVRQHFVENYEGSKCIFTNSLQARRQLQLVCAQARLDSLGGLIEGSMQREREKSQVKRIRTRERPEKSAQRDTSRIHLFAGIAEKGGLSSILESGLASEPGRPSKMDESH